MSLSKINSNTKNEVGSKSGARKQIWLLRCISLCIHQLREALFSDSEIVKYMGVVHENYLTNLLCFRRNLSPIADEALDSQIEQLNKICLSITKDRKHIKSRSEKGLRMLVAIVQSSSRLQLQTREPNVIINCSIKMVLQYDDILYNGNSCAWKRQKRSRLAKLCYTRLLKTFIPEKCKEVVQAVVGAVNREELWQIEDPCFELVWELIECGASGAIVANSMCDKVEQQSSETQSARAIIRTLYKLLDVYHWPRTKDTVIFIERLLELYHNSLHDISTENAHFKSFTRGFELCIRYLIKHASNDYVLIAIRHMCSWAINKNTTNDAILDFGSTLEYAAYVHQTDVYKDSLTSDIFPVLLEMIASSNRLVSLLGNRVLQYLIDRGENRFLFDTPKIFFQDASFGLRKRSYYREDKVFLENHREVVHDCLLKSIVNHCTTRLNLETTFCTICLIAVEIPSGFTAAALVCLVMNVQDLFLKPNNFHREAMYHVHAMIISIMTLLCWIHKAKVFHEYVNKIVMERAQWAPHLNPPIQSRYNFSEHHVRWDKSELFFVDWEVRYGLWKRFRLHEGQNSEKTQ